MITREDETELFELMLPPGIPNLEELLSEVLKKFDLKLISPKELDEPYYLALRGKIETVEAAKEFIRVRLEKFIIEMEKKKDYY